MKYRVALGFTEYTFYEGEEEMMFNFIKLYIDRAICTTITERNTPVIEVISGDTNEDNES